MKYKIIFSIGILLCFNNSFSQRVKRKGTEPIDISKNKTNPYTGPTFTINQFVGKWQETSRAFDDNPYLRFTDTIFLEIDTAAKATTKQGKTAKMIGEAAIDKPGNVLLIAADFYTVLSVDDTKMQLQDEDKTIHTLEKKEMFFSDMLGKLTNKGEVFKDPVAPNFLMMKGKWKVYRRQSKPGSGEQNVKLINAISIKDSTGKQTAKGEIVYFVSDKTEALPCNIYFTNTGFKITADKINWELKLYKADGKELVFGDADVLLYFAKPL